MGAADLELLADAEFWTDRVEASKASRREAYRLWDQRDDDGASARCAWRLFYEHYLVGEVAVANGWLERCRRHVERGPERSAAAGWLAAAEADVALHRGQPADALTAAGLACDVAQDHGDRDLLAMALVAQGRAELDLGAASDGLARLDEAMVAVINDELDPLYTGWVYCNVVSTCIGVADLRRAGEWSAAALRWCTTLREGRLWPGLCRVYAVELACLRGDWSTAMVDARQACEDLELHDRRYAGAAHYLVGELCRLTGRTDEAARSYDRAHDRGAAPQPGLALLLLAEGRAVDAGRALQSALAPGPSAPLARAQLLGAIVEVETCEGGDLGAARLAAEELETLGRSSISSLVPGLAALADGRIQLAEQHHQRALESLRRATEALRGIGLPYDEARLSELVGVTLAHLGDQATARLELRSALRSVEQLGARSDIARLAARLDELADESAVLRSAPSGEPVESAPSPLTDRELDVLRLVAGGATNRAIADRLSVSPHTVARHVSNILTKLGVTSRAAATARAYDIGVLRRTGAPDDG